MSGWQILDSSDVLMLAAAAVVVVALAVGLNEARRPADVVAAAAALLILGLAWPDFLALGEGRGIIHWAPGAYLTLAATFVTCIGAAVLALSLPRNTRGAKD